jgi:hypothetical protein
MTLTLHVLPALHGDALFLEYGKNGTHRLLIDGGPRSKQTDGLIRDVFKGHESPVELVVVTHIDADHITGILGIFQDRDMPLEPRDVWFNGWRHLPTDLLGPEQGEALSDAIEKRGLPWNAAFDGGPVSVPDQGPLPRFELRGDLQITLLSPTLVELAALRPVWKREVEKAGLVPGTAPEPPPKPSDLLGEPSMDLAELATRSFNPDRSQANAASIALLAEHGGRSLLLTGDAHAGVLSHQLRRLALERGLDRLSIDLVKLPHHGSRRNISQELVDAVDCERWLFSTNGAIFSHPDPEAVARVIVDRPGAELMFNYRTRTTDRFDSPELRRSYKHQTRYPQSGPGLRIELPT